MSSFLLSLLLAPGTGEAPADSTLRDSIERMVGDAKKAAELLQDKRPGDETRRLQQNVLKDLDELIKQAELQQSARKNSNSQQGSSNPGSGNSPQSAQRKERRQPRANELTRQGTGQGIVGRLNQSPKGPEGMPRLPDAYKDVWGQLPEKVRQEMDQYFREQFMPRYSDLLRQYYSSLAEHGKEKP